jgi:hypothetical protein
MCDTPLVDLSDERVCSHNAHIFEFAVSGSSKEGKCCGGCGGEYPLLKCAYVRFDLFARTAVESGFYFCGAVQAPASLGNAPKRYSKAIREKLTRSKPRVSVLYSVSTLGRKMLRWAWEGLFTGRRSSGRLARGTAPRCKA